MYTFLAQHLCRRFPRWHGDTRAPARVPFAAVDAWRWRARSKHDGKNDGKSDRFDSLMIMNNGQYLDYLYHRWLKDPQSVDPSWDQFFRTLYADELQQQPQPMVASPSPAPIRVESSSPTIPMNLTGATPSDSGGLAFHISCISGVTSG